MEMAKKHREQLSRLKDNVTLSYDANRSNNERFNEFRQFLFVSTLNNQEKSYLRTIKKPIIEFNTCEAYVSRLLGEFAKNEVGVTVSKKEDSDIGFEHINLCEGVIRNVFYEADKRNVQYEAFKDVLSGGFSCLKIYTDYVSDDSFDQDIYMRRVFDPTMIIFDPMATLPDKSDGEFFGELIPMRKDLFEQENPGIDLKDISFKRNMAEYSGHSLGPFSWSYETQTEKVLLLCDYYEKKRVKKKLVELSNGQIMYSDEYKKLMKDWDAMGLMEQPPVVIKERKTIVVKICRYKFIESEILSYEETELPCFPFIFIEGNAGLLKEGNESSVKYTTRPYIYNAIGSQKLKNFAGQSLANEIENMIQHKFIVAKDSIPPQYEEAYQNIQIASSLVYNPFKNDDPNIPLPAPQALVRPPIPPELTSTFTLCDQLLQNILGSFDGSLSKLADRDVSGAAIRAATSLSNSAALPYFKNFVNGIQSAAQAIVEYIPIAFEQSRNIPLMDEKKNRTYLTQADLYLRNFKTNQLDVKVEAGASFHNQQEIARQYIKELMAVSPIIAQFVNEEGLDILLDNVEMRGIDEFRDRAEIWMRQQKEMKKQQAEMMAKMPNPQMMSLQLADKQITTEAAIEQEKVRVQEEKNRQEAVTKMGGLAIDREKIKNERLKLLADLEKARNEAIMKNDQYEIDKVTKMIDLAIKTADLENQLMDKSLQEAAVIAFE